MILRTHIIIFVADQRASARFYSAVLGSEPTLDVPGMTEFTFPGGAILGLMPEGGIRRLLGEVVPGPSPAEGVPKAELYLVVENPEQYHARALAAGARVLSEFAPRDWGHSAAYSMDVDGHVLAFASEEREHA